jgi:chymotrypsin
MIFDTISLQKFKVALLTTFGAAGTGLCGGSVISSSAILTAAHCSDSRTTSFQIIFGAVNMRINEVNQQRRTVAVSGWIGHPEYRQNSLHNDIAVIRFPAEPIAINQFVQPIALASDTSNLLVGETVHVSGFGRYSDDSQNSSDVLRFTIKNIVTNLSCRIRFPTLVIDSTICAIGDDQINNAV